MINQNGYTDIIEETDVSAEVLESLLTLEQRTERLLSEVRKPSAYYDSLKQKLARIHAAFERIQQGNFGKCCVCSTLINPKRLLYLPYATRCFLCQRDKERREIT